MAFEENQQDCTTEIVSQIMQLTSSLSSEMKSSENRETRTFNRIYVYKNGSSDCRDNRLREYNIAGPRRVPCKMPRSAHT
ncbi:hypothetical protein DPMN_149605 [Dreissena polymorpha]|uniref:Uncharacterized protein n=1 Tax=Dreissena polymorpha TaxID=45954 RepID=A0A9D4J197_DREPO|nr:hypothetical protein DPMN_149605 [Dreissena polymorpha]